MAGAEVLRSPGRVLRTFGRFDVASVGLGEETSPLPPLACRGEVSSPSHRTHSVIVSERSRNSARKACGGTFPTCRSTVIWASRHVENVPPQPSRTDTKSSAGASEYLSPGHPSGRLPRSLQPANRRRPTPCDTSKNCSARPSRSSPPDSALRNRPTASSSTPASPSATPGGSCRICASSASRIVYASPYLKARPGSTHGYDITDHSMSQPGDRHRRGLRGLSPGIEATTGWAKSWTWCPITWASWDNENTWWNDVLENGLASPYAGFFDIDWYASPRAELQGRSLLPVLGEPYGKVLESGQLRLELRRRRFPDRLFRPSLPRRRRDSYRHDPGAAASSDLEETLDARGPRPCSSIRAS